MANLDKNLLKHGSLLAVETGNYGSGTPTLSASTDGVLAYETPEVTVDYADLGEKEGVSGAGTSKLRPAAPSARKGTFDLVHYFKGAGAAYSASVFPTIHTIMQGLGMSATVDVTASAEMWTYAPISTGIAALVAEIYTRGQQTNFAGAYLSSLEINADGLVVPKFTMSAAGIVTALPVDAAVPAITYPSGGVLNPKATNIALTFANGGQTYTAKVRSWTFKMERELDERIDQNLTNLVHAGFFNGMRTVTLEVTIEAASLTAADPWVGASDFNPYGVFENEKDINLDLTVGQTQYNRFRVDCPTARLNKAPSEDREGNIATWGLSFDILPSADGLEDDFTIVAD